MPSKLFSFVFSLLSFVFSRTSLLTTPLIFFKSGGTVFNYHHLNHILLFIITETSWKTLKQKKSRLAVKLDVSAPVALFDSF